MGDPGQRSSQSITGTALGQRLRTSGGPFFSYTGCFRSRSSSTIGLLLVAVQFSVFLSDSSDPLNSTISATDRPLHSLVRNDLLVPRSRTSTSQQCAFASAGPLLWNCLLVKARAQILSSSLSYTPRLLKFFFLGLIALEGSSI